MARWTVSPNTAPNRPGRSLARAPASPSACRSTAWWASAATPFGTRRGAAASAAAAAQAASTSAASARRSCGRRAGRRRHRGGPGRARVLDPGLHDLERLGALASQRRGHRVGPRPGGDRQHQQVAGSGAGHVDQPLPLGRLEGQFPRQQVAPLRLLAGEPVEAHGPGAAGPLDEPGRRPGAGRQRGPRVPPDHHRELEPLGLVDGHHLHRVAADRPGRIEPDRLQGPVAQPGGGAVVVEPLGGGQPLQLEAELPQPLQPLQPVRPAAPRRARGRSGRAGRGRCRPGGRSQASPAQLLDQLPGRPGSIDPRVRRHRGGSGRPGPHQVGQVEGEEGRAQQRRLGHAVVPVGDRPERQQELAVERVLEEELAAAGRPGHAEPVERVEQQPHVGGGVGQDGDVAEAEAPLQPGGGIDHPLPAALHRGPEPGGGDQGLQAPIRVGLALLGRRTAGP